MTNPSPEQVQRKIAELQGWTEIGPYGRDSLIGHPPDSKSKFDWREVPNWPLSLDTARELEIKDWVKFIVALGKILEEPFCGWAELTRRQAIKLLKATPYQWCLAWILYKGWRWVPCENKYCENGEVMEGDMERTCGICSGEKGEWRRV